MKSCSRRADGEHDIGLGGQRIGRGGADDAERPGIHGMLMASTPRPAMVSATGMRCFAAKAARSLAGPGSNAPRRRRGSAAAWRLAQQRRRRRRSRAGRDAGGGSRCSCGSKKRLGIVIGLGLRVLAEGQEGRAAIGRIQHGGDRLGQGAQDLLRPGDAVPIAGHRLEGSRSRSRLGSREMLHLLQHGIGNAAGEDVARAAAAPAGGWHGPAAAAVTILAAPGPMEEVADHDLAPVAALAKPMAASAMDCSFCPRQVGRRSCTASQRLADRQVTLPWPKMPKTPAKSGWSWPSITDPLTAEITDQRLGHGQTNRLHGAPSSASGFHRSRAAPRACTILSTADKASTV